MSAGKALEQKLRTEVAFAITYLNYAMSASDFGAALPDTACDPRRWGILASVRRLPGR
jgi:hypothetical protein